MSGALASADSDRPTMPHGFLSLEERGSLGERAARPRRAEHHPQAVGPRRHVEQRHLLSATQKESARPGRPIQHHCRVPGCGVLRRHLPGASPSGDQQVRPRLRPRGAGGLPAAGSRRPAFNSTSAGLVSRALRPRRRPRPAPAPVPDPIARLQAAPRPRPPLHRPLPRARDGAKAVRPSATMARLLGARESGRAVADSGSLPESVAEADAALVVLPCSRA